MAPQSDRNVAQADPSAPAVRVATRPQNGQYNYNSPQRPVYRSYQGQYQNQGQYQGQGQTQGQTQYQ
jgi:hypothetical protein